jgi:hypothetical protein
MPSVVTVAAVIRTNAPRYFAGYVSARAAFLNALAGTNAPALTGASNNLVAAESTLTNLAMTAVISTNGLPNLR